MRAQRLSSRTATSVRALKASLSGEAEGDFFNQPPRRDRRRPSRQSAEREVRSVPRTYNEATKAYPKDSLPFIKRAGRTASSVDMYEAMVRQLVADGAPVGNARTLADIAVAMAPRKPGPDDLGPRLWLRKNNRIYIRHKLYGKRQEVSTRAVARKGQHYSKHPQALARLAEFVEEAVQQILNKALAGSFSMSQMFLEYLSDHEPAKNDLKEAHDRYSEDVATCAALEEYMGDTFFADIKIDIGLQYAKFRTGEQIKTQSRDVDEDDIRTTKLITAKGHVDLLVKIVNYFTTKHTLQSKTIKKPKVPKQETLWLTSDQWMRLLLAARGWLFDENGKFVGYDRTMRERFAPIVRFIMFYTFGGTRHGNILELLWASDLFRGHVDAARGVIKRQGLKSAVTNKRRGTSTLLGSLKHMAVRWCAEDAAKREKSTLKYTHVVHNAAGLPYSNTLRLLFVEVRNRAGLLDWVTPHKLKHTGVTFCTAAGMTQRQVSLAFSTSMYTLEHTYTHLHEEWHSVARVFNESKLYIRNLRHLTAPSAEEFYGGIVPLPSPPESGNRTRSPLAARLTSKEHALYMRRAVATR